MRHFHVILSHEIRMLAVGAGTYVAAVLFLALMGFVFSGPLLESYTKSPQEVPPAVMFFNAFWLPVLFMVPLLTMRCLSEERRRGTMETLLTAPVGTAEVVLGKYCAAYLLYLLLWTATGAFFLVLKLFAGGAWPSDPAPLLGGYLFIAASGLFFVALGILASALSRNQAVAGVLAFVLLFALIFGLRFAASADLPNTGAARLLRESLGQASLFRHLEDFSAGIVDTRHLLYYASGAVFSLVLAVLSLEAKLLHS
ncbi:MAG: ABC transporter permease subunit [Opitutaceae bacterium]|nr:ABC transporter permease subunit [Opitutaceae bacterium]